jgi:Uncharacterised protein family (UPF0149)
MKMFSQHAPLTEAELDRLGNFLNGCKGGRAMNVEQLDGFFAALIAGPEPVMPSEYYGRDVGSLRVSPASTKPMKFWGCDAPLEQLVNACTTAD